MGDPGGNAPTTAIPAQRDADPATEKLDTSKVRDKAETGDDAPTRRSGGLSAADLLRREGRL
jgi:RND superfamily putative drug exporter